MQKSDEKKTISAKRLMYSAALFIIASNLLTKNLYQLTKNQSWISVVIALVFGLVLIALYGRLIKNHSGCNLFDINETVFGSIVGKTISALYVFFFLSLTVFNTRDLGSFVSSIVLPATPTNLVYVVFIAICIYSVKKGAENILQYGAFILYVYLVLLFFISSLLLTKMHPDNFLPIFTVPVKNYILSAHLVTMLPFCEIIAFLVMTQFMEKPKATGKALRGGLLIGAAVTLLLVLRDIAVLGDYTLYTSSPTFNTVRLVDVGDILTRLEIINAVLQIILLFFKTSILLYATVTGVGMLFHIEHYRSFVFIISALVIVSANFFFRSSFEQMQWMTAAGSYATIFLFILPLMTLIMSEIKKITGQKKSVDLAQKL